MALSACFFDNVLKVSIVSDNLFNNVIISSSYVVKLSFSFSSSLSSFFSFSFRTSFPYYLTLHQLATQQQQGNTGNEEIKTERTQAEQHQAKVNQQCADKLGVRYSLVHQGRTFLVLGLEPVLQARNDIHTTTRAECGYIGCFHCLSDLAVMNRETAVLPRVAKPLKQCSVTRAKVKVGKGSRCIKIPDMRMSLFRQCCTLYIIWQPRIPSPGTYEHKKSPTWFVEHLTVALNVTCSTRYNDLALQILEKKRNSMNFSVKFCQTNKNDYFCISILII